MIDREQHPPESRSDHSETRSSPPDREQLSAGTVIDHFRIMRVLGHGGMGTVHLARDTKLGRKVALKLVHPKQFESPETVQRFLVEARVTARFNHPNIVTLYEVGEHEGRPYLALEHVRGEDLKTRMRGGALSPRESMRLARAIASALREAHRHGVLHRDLKPGNVLIGRDGRARVLDFGLAKSFETERSSLEPSQLEPSTGSSHGESSSLDAPAAEESWGVGTPAYMAPEQWLGHGCTSATDIWAFGVVLYAMLAGHPPFSAPTLADLGYAISHEEHESLGGRAGMPPELVDLVDRCLSKFPGDRPPAAEAVSVLDELIERRGPQRVSEGESPFRGLMPFSERHAHLFFGRDAEIAAMVERLRSAPAQVVLGPTGAGKSSFVHAGLVPRLREQEAWLVLSVRPGARPLTALAHALLRGDPTLSATTSARGRRLFGASRTLETLPEGFRDEPTSDAGPEPKETPGDETEEVANLLAKQPRELGVELRALAEETHAKVLVVVDQLEEVETLSARPEERGAFLEALRLATDDPSEPVRVVITLRDDYLGRLATSSQIRELLSQVTLLQRPDDKALRQILTRPLTQVGYRYEDEQLVDEMIDELGGEPASLPILQFALSRLWDEREQRRKLLLRSAYEAMGGVGGALARHADGVVASLADDRLPRARELLLRMVTPEGTRRMVSEERLLDGLGEGASEVLARLTDARLLAVRKMASPQGRRRMFELTHESLVTHWGTLRRWLEESREDLAFLAEAEQAAALWERRGRRTEELWTGEALRECRRALARLTEPAPPAVREFVAAAERRQRRRLRRRRLGYLAVVLVLAGAATAAALAALFVREQRDLAEVERAEALREGARAAWSQGNVLEARAKLRPALERRDSTMGRALWWKLRDEPLAWRVDLESSCHDVAITAQGVVAASQDGPLYAFDETTASQRIWRGHTDQVLGLASSPDGARVASTSLDGTVRIWNVATGRTERILEAEGTGLHGVAFSPDGERVAAGGYDRRVHRWNATTGEPLSPLRGHEAAVRGVAYAPGGELLASAGTDRVVRLWETDGGAPAGVLSGHDREAFGVTFSPDGTKVGSSSYDGKARIWNTADRTLAKVVDHGAVISHIAFGPEGRRLVTAGGDRRARTWDVESGRRLAAYEHSGQVTGVIFGDGDRLATSTTDGEISYFHLDRRGPPPLEEGHGAYVSGVAFSPDGSTLASSGYDHRIRLWDTGSGEPRGVLAGHDEAVGAVTYAGAQIVSAGKDATVRLWDAETGRPGPVLRDHTAEIFSLAVSPDRRLLATGSYDQTARLWRLPDGAPLHVLDRQTDRVRGLAFSPDGTTLAVSSYDRRIRLYDVEDGSMIEELTGHEHRVYGLSFSPDGTTLASGSYDRTLRLWDLDDAGAPRILGRASGRIYDIAFHPSGDWVGAPSSAGQVLLFSVEDGRARRLGEHRNEANVVRFDPSGEVAASASDDGTIRLWDVESEKPRWWGRALVREEGRAFLLSHRGWRALDSGEVPEASWRQPVESASVVSQSPDGETLCIRGSDAISMRQRRGPVSWEGRAAAHDRLVAVDGACVAWGSGGAQWLDATGERTLSTEPVRAAAAAGNRAALLIGDEAIVFADGQREARHALGVGVSALALDGDGVLLGYTDGSFGAEGKTGTHFEHTPSSPVERIAPSGIPPNYWMNYCA